MLQPPPSVAIDNAASGYNVTAGGAATVLASDSDCNMDVNACRSSEPALFLSLAALGGEGWSRACGGREGAGQGRGLFSSPPPLLAAASMRILTAHLAARPPLPPPNPSLSHR